MDAGYAEDKAYAVCRNEGTREETLHEPRLSVEVLQRKVVKLGIIFLV